MQAVFGIKRERENKLYYHEYENSNGVFHFHSQVELCFVTEGELEVVVNSHGKKLKKGEMSIALSFDSHAYHTSEHSKASFLFIPTYMCQDFVDETKDKQVMEPFICDKDVVEQLLIYVKHIVSTNNEIKKKGYLYVLMGTIMENLIFETKHTSKDTDLSSKLLFYINENFAKDISLAEIANTFGYNQAYISRYFKESFNIGIRQYITMNRLRNALMLMHENRYNVTYCALESGFTSMRTFYRVFYKEFQCSPTEYLSEHKFFKL